MHAPPLSQHPYAPFLHAVEKPARYLGGEFGQIRKDWEQAAVRVCLAFPDLYDIGMSHLGTRILYQVLNAQEDILCERAFAPWHDMEKELRARSLPLVSLESARPLRDFDVVGISLQHELVFSNCLTLLDLGGIPLRACDRNDTHPLVLGGGSIATHPEPLAPFFDAFVVGDGERKAVEVARCWASTRGEGRAQRLHKLAQLGGVYVPSLYETRTDSATGRVVIDRARFEDVPLPVRRAVVDDLEEYPFPEQFPVGGPQIVFERLSFEIARGCMQGCRFCQAGMIFRPQRDRDPARLAEAMERAVRWSGEDEVALTSLSTADYPHVGGLISELAARFDGCNVALGVSSLRAYGLSDEVLDQIRKVRATGLTFAPEAGTQRMRDLINKNVTDEQITQTAERALARGWDRLKFYFMIGLPTETREDVAGIVDTTSRAREAGRRSRGKGRPVTVTASVSTFAPKPHTPLQWERMIGIEEVLERQHLLKDRARAQKIELKVHPMFGSMLEGILCRGDRRLADVIETAWRNGARFDAWEGAVPWDTWMAALDACGFKVQDWLAELPVGSTLPWDHIDVGVERAFLERERDKAMKGKTTPACGRPLVQDGKLVCFQCGMRCDLDAMAEERKNAAQRLADTGKPSACPCHPEQLNPEPDVPSSDGCHGQAKLARAPEPQRYRLCLEKIGRGAFLGHLDMVRELPRLLQRAGVPLWYSQGFHPKPVMSFGPALSLGVPSLRELIDIKTASPIDLEPVQQRINTMCPDGLTVLSIEKLEQGDPAIGACIQSAEYLLGIDPGRTENVNAVVQARSWAEVIVKREKDGITREFALKDEVLSLEPADAPDRETFERAGVGGDWTLLRATLRIGQNGTLRVQELVDVLSGSPDTDHRAVRLRLRSGE